MDAPGLLILLLAGWIGGVVLLTLYTARMLTHPPRRTTAYAVSRQLPASPGEVRVVLDGVEHPLEHTEWSLHADSEFDLPVWDVRGLRTGGPIVVVTHGWGDSRVVMLTRAAVLVKHASRVILWDLPAHGDSPRSSGPGFTLGLREPALLRALVRTIRADDDDASIVLYGYSLGAGVSIAAAADPLPGEPAAPARIDAVIAEAPYRVPITPARRVLVQAGLPHRLSLPLAMLLIGLRLKQGAAWIQREDAGGFDRRGLAARLTRPLLILHGERDAICPVHDARDIAHACSIASREQTGSPGATLVEIPGGGHLDLWTDARHADACEAAVAGFLAGVARRTQPGRRPEHAQPSHDHA